MRSQAIKYKVAKRAVSRPQQRQNRIHSHFILHLFAAIPNSTQALGSQGLRTKWTLILPGRRRGAHSPSTSVGTSARGPADSDAGAHAAHILHRLRAALMRAPNMSRPANRGKRTLRRWGGFCEFRPWRTLPRHAKSREWRKSGGKTKTVKGCFWEKEGISPDVGVEPTTTPGKVKKSLARCQLCQPGLEV